MERDEIAAARRKKQQMYRRKRRTTALRVLAAVAVVVLAAVLITAADLKAAADFFKTSFSRGGYPVELSDTTPQQVEQLSSAFCVRTKDRVMVFSASGAPLSQITPIYSDIGLSTYGSGILVYNTGGQQAQFCNRTSQLYEVTAPAEIISGAAGPGGRSALLCRSDRYAGELNIYNSRGERVMSWYCASNFPYLAAFDRDGSHVAVCAAYINGGVMCTEVTIIDVGQKTEALKVSFPFSVIELSLNNCELLAVGDTASAKTGSDGAVLASYDYSGASLLMISHEKNGGLALAFGDNGKPRVNRVEWLNSDLEQLCEINVGKKIKDICVSSGRLFVLTDSQVIQYAMSGDVSKTGDADYNALAIAVKGRVIEILPDSAVTIKMEG